LKKNLFQINRSREPQSTLEDRTEHIEIKGCYLCDGVKCCLFCNGYDEEIIAMGTLAQWLLSISEENNMTIGDLLSNIFRILNSESGKKNSIILIGASDAGKTLFANFLCSPWQDFEIGNFKLPTKTTCNSFWLENLPGAQVYRCEEMILENAEIIQLLKSLLEGNANLEADIKYKSPISVPKRPVIITMNGDRKTDVTKFFSSEFEAINNRALILYFKKPMKLRIMDGDLNLLMQHSLYLIKVLMKKYYKKEEKKNTVLIDFCNSFTEQIL